MALQIWLPLNGNLNNQGLNNVTVTNSGAAVDNSGKIGKCYSFDGSNDYIDTGWGNNHISKNLSICLWVKPLSSLNNKIVFGVLNGTNQRLYLGIKNDTYNIAFRGYSWGRTSNAPATINIWSHLVITIDNNGRVLLYQDGVLTNETYTSSADFNFASNIFLGGRTDGYYANCLINDFRIYDNCLSPKEVKELSKGLILHYPLNDVSTLMSKCGNITWNQLANPTNISETTSKNVTFSITDRKYINLQTTQDGIDGTGVVIIRTNYLNEDLIAGTGVFRQQNNHKYYSPNTLPNGIYFAQNNFDGGITPFSGIIQTGVRPSNQSTIQYWSLKGTGGTVIPEKIQCPLMIFDLTQMFGEGNEPTKEEFEMMFPLDYYSYDTGTIKNLKLPIYDCSGYGNNGTITGNLTLDSSSPRYNLSTYFDGNSAPFILRDSITSEILTISAWIKTTKNKSTSQLVVSDSLSQLCISFYSGCIIAYYGPRGSQGVGSKCTLGSSYKENDWNHIVVVKTGTGTRKVYCNAVEQIATSNDYWSATSTGFRIGNRTVSSLQYFGYISDIRVYSTALSEKSIKELYNISGYVDNNGDVFQYKLDERCDNLFKIEYWNETINLTRSRNQYVTYTDRNGSKAVALPANWFYYSSSESEIAKSHYKGRFKENTQYKFDFWIDYDDIVYNDVNRMGGIIVYYTDGTSTQALCGTGNYENPLGWQHKFFISSENKSISSLGVYYWTATPAYYRWDSTIVEIDNKSTKINKFGINSTGQFRECSEIAKINKGNHFDTNQIIEI